MAKFKVIVSDPEAGTSKVVELEEARAAPFIGRRLGEIVDGSVVDLPAHKVQILGGSDKGLNYDEMGEEIVKSGNVENVILIGQIALEIEEALDKANFKGSVTNLGMTTMKKIVELAYKESKPGWVVLLSPATASFGMFKDYKDRGNQFKEAAKKL